MDEELKPDTSVELPTESHKVEARELKPEDFYGQADCCYVRLKYNAEIDAFKFEVKNELLEKYEANAVIPKGILSVAAFVRGMLEFALAYPHQMYRVGMTAMNADMMDNMGDMSAEQKALLMGDMEGSA